jgi:hypothetical protein
MPAIFLGLIVVFVVVGGIGLVACLVAMARSGY